MDTGVGMRCSGRAWRWSLVVLSVAVAAAGCTGSGQQPVEASSSGAKSPSPHAEAPPSPGSGCPEEARQGQVVHFGDAGATSLGGILVGQGPSGVVLINADIGNLCVWLPYALSLSKRGYRVLAFDRPGQGASNDDHSAPDVATVVAAQWLRSQGAAKVFLIGANEGATLAMVAAARINPPVAGLVSLSGHRLYGGLNAEQALNGLLVPAMFVAAELPDGDVEEAQALFDAMPAKGVLHSFLAVPNSDERGVRLLAEAVPYGGSSGDTVHAQIEHFLQTLTSTGS